MYTVIVGSQQGLLRNPTLKSVLYQHEIPFKEIEAIFLKDFPDEYSPKRALTRGKRSLNIREIGCIKVHNSAYTDFLNSEENWALIIEDDGIITDIAELKKAIDFLINFDCQWPMVVSLYFHDTILIGARSIAPNILKVVGIPPSAVAYFINRQAAVRLVESHKSFSFPADWPRDSGVHFYGWSKKCITHPINRNQSLIGMDRNYKQNKRIIRILSDFTLITYIRNRTEFRSLGEYSRILIVSVVQRAFFSAITKRYDEENNKILVWPKKFGFRI